MGKVLGSNVAQWNLLPFLDVDKHTETLLEH